MIRNISVGIDLGSSTTRVVVGEFVKGENNPKIIGVGESNSIGMRHGYIVDPNSALVSLKNAISMAEKSADIKIKRAYVSVSGMSLRSESMSGSTVISKANGEVTNLDVSKVLEDCEDNLHLNNKKVIQVYPVSFKLDGKEVLGRLEGMRGTKLEAKALFVTYSIQHLEDLLGVITRAGVEPLDIIAAPIALATTVLSDKQKIVGVALVDIGADTTSLSVFENGSLISTHAFGIGSNDITNDIALGFKIPLEKAEMLKLGNVMDEDFPKRKLDEVIDARMCDIFESIENYLKKIKRAELLPAGVVFVGGGANTPGLIELSKSFLKLPSTIGAMDLFGNSKTKLRDPAWFTVLSLLSTKTEGGGYGEDSFGNILRDLKSMLKSGLKQLMP